MKADRKKQTRFLLRDAVARYGDAIALYRAPDGTVNLDVRLDKDTLWLSLHQIADLFRRDKSVISRHLRNIFATNELDRDSVVALSATTASDGKTYQVEYYNLDAILSVGYRVNSKRGTQFRIWATQVLRDHVLKGHSVNQRRLNELRQSLHLVAQVLERHEVSSDQAKELLRVIVDYERALDLLDDYDHERLARAARPAGPVQGLAYDEACALIKHMRTRYGASSLFGREKDGSLQGSLNAILQTFDGRDMYPSLEDKAAHLLYFLVKNHSFVDGNKRIAAALFLRFLEKNRALYRPDGTKRLADATLVAITLMIAESRVAQKDNLTNVIVQLISLES